MLCGCGGGGRVQAPPEVPQKTVRTSLFSSLHLCPQMDSAIVCYHQLMSQQAISEPQCIFFLIWCMLASLAEVNQLTQVHAKSRKGRLTDQDGRNVLLYLSGVFGFAATGRRLKVMIVNLKGHLGFFLNSCLQRKGCQMDIYREKRVMNWNVCWMVHTSCLS